MIAIDGKWLRGVADGQVKLFAVMLHGDGVVIAQHRIPDDTNEITQVRNLPTRWTWPRGKPLLMRRCPALHRRDKIQPLNAGGSTADRQGQPARPAARHL